MLVALVAILSAYLLPFLVGRREAMRRSNADDRYSSELRVLATGDALASDASDEECDGGGRAQIFRRRPEVKAMNRPAVRNVRALRTERELIRARQAHEEARGRRRVAASHRAAVACTITGVLLGLVVVCSLTALPWPSLAVPGVLLLVSLGAGRRAALASAALDRRERRRIAELEDELTDLTGERPAAPASVHPIASKDKGRDERVTSPRAAAERTTAEPVAGEEPADSAPARRTAAAAKRKASPAARRAPAASEAAEPVGSAAETGGAAASAAEAVRTAERAGASAAGAPSADGMRRRRAAEEPAESAERPAARSGEGAAVQQALRAVAWPVTELEADDGPSEPAPEPASGQAGPERDATPARRRRTTTGGAEQAASTAREAVREAAPATPPQGWHPVHVPAPTYTLAARAPRRALEELEEESYPSAPVPARPSSLRTLATEGVEKEEIEFHPIDLDAVLEKRRAAGA